MNRSRRSASKSAKRSLKRKRSISNNNSIYSVSKVSKKKKGDCKSHVSIIKSAKSNKSVISQKSQNFQKSKKSDKSNLSSKLNKNNDNLKNKFELKVINTKIHQEKSISPKRKQKKIILEDEDSDIEDFSKLIPFNENLNLIANDELSTSINYTPERIDILEKLTDSQIYCRDKERDYILNFFENEEEVKSLFICGQPGTGKTSLMNEIFKSHLTSNKFCFKIYINCMSLNSIKDFNEEIFKFFNKTSSLTIFRKIFKSKKYDSLIKILKTNPSNLKIDTLCNVLNILNSNDVEEKMTPIILLDEIDHFYQKNDDIAFFDILSIPYLSSCNLKILMISNNSEFDKYILPKIENRKIKISKYVFKPYTHVEINKILIQKLIETGFKDNFEENAIRFISSKLANKSGDLRPALEIIKSILLNQKEEISNGKKVDLREVMIILKHKTSSFSEIIKNLTFEQKVVISSIYFSMINSESSIITEEQILKQYRIIKKENFNNEINLRDYGEVIKSLQDLGIILKHKNKSKQSFKIEPRMEEIQLIFGEDEKLFHMFSSTNSVNK